MNCPPIDRETAERYLADVEPAWRSFWFGPHLMVLNLEQFAQALQKIDSQTYARHVSEREHELARWVREVVGDGELAEDLDRARIRTEAAQLARRRVGELRQAVGRVRT